MHRVDLEFVAFVELNCDVVGTARGGAFCAGGSTTPCGFLRRRATAARALVLVIDGLIFAVIAVVAFGLVVQLRSCRNHWKHCKLGSPWARSIWFFRIEISESE